MILLHRLSIVKNFPNAIVQEKKATLDEIFDFQMLFRKGQTIPIKFDKASNSQSWTGLMKCKSQRETPLENLIRFANTASLYNC